MIYSQLYLKDRFKIPSVIAFLLLLFILVFFLRIFSNLSIPSRAAKKMVRRVEITNLTPNQTAVYWQTATKETGWIVFGETERNINQTASDERDLQTQKNPYINHYIVLRNLTANKKYYFKIVSNNQLVINNNNLPFTFTTSSNNVGAKNIGPAYGKVIKANGSPQENAIVLIKFENENYLSALTKSTGEWLIPLNTVGVPTPQEKITIEIINEESQTSTAVTNLSKISPLPQTVIIGTNYDFLSDTSVLSETTAGSRPEKKEIDIIYPQENALIPGYRPLIKGVALPNSEVMIIVNSEKSITAKVKTDKEGLWSLILPENLLPGDHTITIVTKGRGGEEIKSVRKFIIAKQGEQVLGEATAEPTISLSLPTASPTVSQTLTATAAAPVSGGSPNMYLFGAASFIIIGLGLILVF